MRSRPTRDPWATILGAIATTSLIAAALTTWHATPGHAASVRPSQTAAVATTGDNR